MKFTMLKISTIIFTSILISTLVSCNKTKEYESSIILTQKKAPFESAVNPTTEADFSLYAVNTSSENNQVDITTEYVGSSYTETVVEPRTWIPKITSLNENEIDFKKNPKVKKKIYEVSSELINPNATIETKQLMNFLCDIYGRYILTGQFANSPKTSSELEVIKTITGREPALLGFDMMDYSPSRVSFKAVGSDILNAMEWSVKSGGIVSFCWHWNAPEQYLINSEEHPWWKGFYTDATNINLNKILSGEDKEGYDLLVSDIDAIANHLRILQDAGIPVLWRPLHEAGGGDFWWSSFSDDSYVALWKLMYSRLTFHNNINNLIWVWNSKNINRYPGDNYVDIIGMDIYTSAHDYSSGEFIFSQAYNKISKNKLITLAENGVVPSINNIFADGGIWSWFMTWNGEFVVKGDKYTQKYTETNILYDMYNHVRSLTLDELPDLTSYPIHN